MRVVVTGLGAVTPLGLGARHSWKRLIDGHSGLVSLGAGGEFSQQQCRVAGIVPENDEAGSWRAADWISRNDERRMSRYMQYSMAASQEAVENAGWFPGNEAEKRMTGVSLGSGIGSLEEIYNTSIAYEKGGPKKVSPVFVPKILINLTAGHIAIKHGFKGPNTALTTACTTGAHSIRDAAKSIATGETSVMLAGGAESCVFPLALTAFERSRSLTTSHNSTPSEASRPFDKSRDGFVIGEGAAVMVLESLEHAVSRSARIYAEIAGWGATCDAYHITAPPSSGEGAFWAMHSALRMASVPPSKVDYINAHATSTPLGDAAENQAIKALMLGEHGKKSAKEINVSSTKGAVGHLLGAAGAIEAVWTVMAIQDGIIPPTLNLRDVDGPGFDCNYVPLVAQEKRVDVALSNSFGFGGTNASLCFKRWTGE